MNLVRERLDVTKNFVTIDSPIKFWLQVNDDEEHLILKSPQALQIDCRKLLSKAVQPNEPIWKMYLVYDADLLTESQKVTYYAHNVNLGDSMDSVEGMPVSIDWTDLFSTLNDNNGSLITNIGEDTNSIISVLNNMDSLNRNVDVIEKYGKLIETGECYMAPRYGYILAFDTPESGTCKLTGEDSSTGTITDILTFNNSSHYLMGNQNNPCVIWKSPGGVRFNPTNLIFFGTSRDEYSPGYDFRKYSSSSYTTYKHMSLTNINNPKLYSYSGYAKNTGRF